MAFLAALAFLLFASCMPAPAPAQLGPQARNFYQVSGPIPVRLFDGGTQARDVFTARRNLDVPWRSGADSLTAQWIMSGSLILPWTYLRDSLTHFQSFADTSKVATFNNALLSAKRWYQFPNKSGILVVNNTGTSCDNPACLDANQVFTGQNTFTNGTGVTFGPSSVLNFYLDGSQASGLAVRATFPDVGSGGDVLMANVTRLVQPRNGLIMPYTYLGGSITRFYDTTDSTKKAALSLSGITTGTTRTYTAPNKNGTIVVNSTGTACDNPACLDGTNDFTQPNTFEAVLTANTNVQINNASYLVMQSSDGTHTNSLGFTGTANAFSFLPASGTTNTLLSHSLAQPVGNKTLYTTNTAKFKDSGFTLTKAADTTKTAVIDCSQLTAARRDTLPNVSGNLVVRLNARDFVALSGNVSATDIATSPSAGMYRVTIYGVTTGLLGAGVSVVVSWTDPQQAQTATAFTLGTALGSEASMTIPVEVASGSIQLSSSGYLTGTYSVYVRVEGPL